MQQHRNRKQNHFRPHNEWTDFSILQRESQRQYRQRISSLLLRAAGEVHACFFLTHPVPRLTTYVHACIREKPDTPKRGRGEEVEVGASGRKLKTIGNSLSSAMADGTSERYVQLGLAVVLIAVLHGMLGLLVQGLLLQLGVLVPVAAGEAVLLLLLLVLVVEVGTSEAFSRGKGLEVCWGAGKGLTLLGGEM